MEEDWVWLLGGVGGDDALLFLYSETDLVVITQMAGRRTTNVVAL